MKKKNIFQLSIIIITGIVSLIISKWFPRTGMFICGACFSLSFVTTIGLYLAHLTSKRIDKRMADYILNKD